MTDDTSYHPVLVWDAPLRVFHWLLALSFTGAYLSAESERWRLVHVTLGYTMAGLVVFRIIWGLIGPRHARFVNFVRSPGAALRYLRSLVDRNPEHHAGHNPAGGLAIVALLALAALTTAFGWATYNELGGDWLSELHETSANLMLGVIVVHLIGVAVGSWAHRENLVSAMLTGRKPGTPADAIRRSWRIVAAGLLVAVLGFWWLQWHNAPAAADAGAAVQTQNREESDDD